MQQTESAPQSSNSSVLTSLQVGGLVFAAIGIILAVFGAVTNLERFFPSYLLAFLFWLEVTLGCLGFLLVTGLIQGDWTVATQRILSAGARVVPLMVILLLPILFDLGGLYPWVDNAAGGTTHAYLNVPFFAVRTALSFVIWIFLAYLIAHWNFQLDSDNDGKYLRWIGRAAGLGLVLFVITASFAAFDWTMSLTDTWFSSLYGLLVISRMAVAGFAFTAVILALVWKQSGLEAIMSQRLKNDMANLMLATVMVWMYMQFMQFLIMWYGNLPKEVAWYVLRLTDGWGGLAVALVVLHFFVPFFVLILPGPNRTMGLVATVGVLLLVMHYVGLYWVVMPSFTPTLAFHWLDIALVLGMGGIWVALFAWLLKQHRLLPANNPSVDHAIERAEHEHELLEEIGMAS